MNSQWLIGALLVFALAVGAAVYLFITPKPTTGTPTTVEDRPLKTFYNPTYGIALNYPDNYEVQEHDATGEGTKHHTLVIGDKDALANVPQNSEGPPVITIDIFDNAANSDAEKWIKGTSNSNYKLSPDGVLSSTTVAGEDAVAYVWDGLYRSTSIVFNHKKRIFMVSVGYNSPDDQIYKDFAKVVSSIQFDP